MGEHPRAEPPEPPDLAAVGEPPRPGRPDIPDVEARPIRALLWVALIGLALLLYGVFEPGDVLDSTVARTVWITVATTGTLVLAIPPLWGRLHIVDGVMTKRAWRTTRVDLRDLAAIATRGDRPWQTNPPGRIRFEGRSGGAVEVPLVSGPWVPTAPLWRSLAIAIEASGHAMPGILGAHVELYVERSLDVAAANRAALERCRADLRRGEVTPHTTGAGIDTARIALLAVVPFAVGALLLVTEDDLSSDTVVTVRAIAMLVLTGVVAALVWRWTACLGLRHDGVLVRTRRPARISLTDLAAVRLHPDRPFLSTTVQGRRPVGPRSPSLRLVDTSGGSLTVELGGRWHAPVPILRYVLAAAEERGLPLSEHARYELEFHCGLTGRVRYPAEKGRPGPRAS